MLHSCEVTQTHIRFSVTMWGGKFVRKTLNRGNSNLSKRSSACCVCGEQWTAECRAVWALTQAVWALTQAVWALMQAVLALMQAVWALMQAVWALTQAQEQSSQWLEYRTVQRLAEPSSHLCSSMVHESRQELSQVKKKKKKKTPQFTAIHMLHICTQ